MAAKIKKGDPVIVITGKNKGKVGEVLKAFPSEKKILVSGINIVKKHQRPNRESNGDIIKKEAKIAVSNVAYLDPKKNRATRIGFKLLDNGKKVRVTKISGEVIDN